MNGDKELLSSFYEHEKLNSGGFCVWDMETFEMKNQPEDLGKVKCMEVTKDGHFITMSKKSMKFWL
jgi:tricorn protease-like protein